MSEERLRKPATYEDLLAIPEHRVAELIDGEIYSSPRPASRHALSASRLAGRLFPAFDHGGGGAGGWVLLFEPELHLGKHVVVPDLAGWRRERMPEFPDVAYFELAPDWVCEVLSPSTESLDRVKKLRVYAEAGVKHAWLINPLAKTLEVLRLSGGGHWTLTATHAENETVRAEPFEAIELSLAALWAS